MENTEEPTFKIHVGDKLCVYLKSRKILNWVVSKSNRKLLLCLQIYIHSKLKVITFFFNQFCIYFFHIYFIGCLYINGSCHWNFDH